MGAKERREIGRFVARSDDGSYKTTIIIYQDFVDAGSRGNPNAVLPGTKHARTIDGYACNRIDDDTFEVVNDPLHPETIVRRVR